MMFKISINRLRCSGNNEPAFTRFPSRSGQIPHFHFN
jgi:hypothetical protein